MNEWDLAQGVDALLAAKRGYVYAIASKMTKAKRYAACASAVSVDDLFQVGMIGLWRAIQGFDNSKGASLKTYATRMIMYEMKGEIRAMGHVTECGARKGDTVDCVSLDTTHLPLLNKELFTQRDIADDVEDSDLLKRCAIRIGKKRRDGDIFSAVMMGDTLSNVAKRYEISRERVRQIVFKIKKDCTLLNTSLYTIA